MRLILNDDVHGALVDGDFVLLDVAADAYFCLPAGMQRLALDGRRLDAEPDNLAQAFCEAGLAHQAADDNLGSEREAIAGPSRTARAWLDAEPALQATRVRPRHILALARAILVARQARRKAFGERLAPRPDARPSITNALLADLAVFRCLSPWVPIDGACLFRSELLRAYLRVLGHEATWVFGVRTWPFRAHCWLQVEDLALDDEAERLAAFAPIMAV